QIDSSRSTSASLARTNLRSAKSVCLHVPLSQWMRSAKRSGVAMTMSLRRSALVVTELLVAASIISACSIQGNKRGEPAIKAEPKGAAEAPCSKVVDKWGNTSVAGSLVEFLGVCLVANDCDPAQ